MYQAWRSQFYYSIKASRRLVSTPRHADCIVGNTTASLIPLQTAELRRLSVPLPPRKRSLVTPLPRVSCVTWSTAGSAVAPRAKGVSGMGRTTNQAQGTFFAAISGSSVFFPPSALGGQVLPRHSWRLSPEVFVRKLYPKGAVPLPMNPLSATARQTQSSIRSGCIGGGIWLPTAAQDVCHSHR